MKKLTLTALVAGQLMATAQPAVAAELTEHGTQRAGTFAGLRLSVPLDRAADQQRVRAGLTVAPTMHSRTPTGESRLRIGEGLELGVVGAEPPRLMIAGTPMSRLAQGPVGPDGRRVGVSTGGWIAIGVGTVVAVLGVGYLVFAEMMDCDEDEECS